MISLNDEDFDPVLRYGYRKRMEEDPFIPFVLKNGSSGRITSSLFILSGGVVCRAF